MTIKNKINPGFEIGPGFFIYPPLQRQLFDLSQMKGSRKIQHHPGQENKTGKATYASTTATNSSTVQSTVADEKTRQFPCAKKRHGPFSKIFKQ